MRKEQEVVLQDLLDAKEHRAQLQRELRERYQATVVGISVNMPGNRKYTADTVQLVYFAVLRLRELFYTTGGYVLEERVLHGAAGPYALLAIAAEAAQVKRMAMELEEESSFGRLLDIDVFDSRGQQVNRALLGVSERACLVCSEAAVLCVRSRAHSSEEVMAAVRRRLVAFRARRTAMWPPEVERIGVGALEAMLMEVACSPAPGLVDRFNSGAHADMDFFTFVQSSSVLGGAMHRCAMAGWQHEGESPALLPVLRRIGIEAEREMFAATGGVNTQKGLLFLMGIIAAAAALTLRAGRGAEEVETAILGEAAAMCSGIVERELLPLRHSHPARKLTAGERLFLEHGVTGVRGEIESGMPVIVEQGLPRFREARAAGLSVNDAMVHALLGLMTATHDTTILHRHDMATLQEVRRLAKEILAQGGMLSDEGRRQIEALDEEFSRRRISPGGSADLLAITYFLDFMSRGVGSGDCGN